MKILLKILKILGYVLGGIVAFVLVILIAVNFLLQTSFFTGFVLGKVLPGVGESLGADIQVKTLRISLAPTSVLIEGAHFTPAKGEFKHKFISVDRLFLDMDTAALFGGRAVIEKLEIVGLQNYLLMQNGLANLPRSDKPKEEKPEEEKKDSGPLVLKYPVVIQDFRIEKSAFFMDMPDSKMELGIRDMFLGLKASLETGQAEMTVAFKDGFFDQGDIHETLTSLDIAATADLHQWTAKIASLAVRVPGVSIDADATAKDLMGDLAALVNLKLEVDASKAGAFVKEPKLAGKVTLDSRIDLAMPKSGMTYQVDGRLALTDMLVNQLPINLATDLSVNTQQVEVKNLEGKVGTGGFSLWALLGLGQGMPLDSKIVINSLDVGDAAGKYGVKLPMTGVLDVNLVAQGSLAKPTGQKNEEGKEKTELALAAKGTVGLANFVMGSGAKRIVAIPKIGVNLDAGYAGTIAKINELKVTTSKSTIEVAGTYNTKGPMDIKANLILDDLAEFSPITGKKIGGAGKLSATAKGTAQNPNVKALLQFDKLLFDAFAVDEIAGSLGMNGKLATIDSLTVRAGGSHVKVQGKANLGKPMKVDATVKIPEGQIGDFLALAGKKDLKVAGKINVDVDVDGPVDGLTGKVKVNLDDIAAFDEKVQAISLDAKLDSGVVNLNELRIVKMAPPRPDLRARRDVQLKEVPKDQWLEVVIAAQGRFDTASGDIDLKLRTKNLSEQASDVIRKKNIPFYADLGLSADVSGTIKDPVVQAKLEVLRARYENFILGDTVIAAGVKDQQATVHGDILANRWEEKSMSRHSDEWIIYRRDPNSAPPPKAPETADEVEDFTTDVNADSALDEKGRLGAITLDVTAGLKGDQPLTGKLLFDRFDYSGFLTMLKEDESRKKEKQKEKEGEESIVEGRLDGQIDLEGALKQAAEILVNVNLKELYFRKNSFILRNEDSNGQVKPIALSMRGKTINIDQFRLGGKGIDLSIDKGDVNGRDGFWLDGKIDLAIVKEFAPIVTESKGKLLLEASLPADFNPADAQARLIIKDGLFDVQNSPTAIENFNFIASFANSQANIDRLTANIGGGTLNGEGRVELDSSGAEEKKPPKINLVVKLRNVKTGIDPYLEAAVNKVDLFINNRDKGGMQISGEVVIDKAVYSQDIDLLSILRSFQEPKKVSGSTTFKEKKESLFFNVAIRADKNVAFQNNFVDIESRLDLLFTGSNAAPALLGNIELLKGDATVMQNHYEVSRGVITFIDEDRIYPNFDINVETLVRNNTIFVIISGNPDRYKITFSSDPPMPERDIVTMLALGVSYEEFQASDEGGIGGDDAAALAAQQLIGGHLRGLTGESGIEIGVDSAAGQPRLKIKKELEKNFYLSIFRGISDSSMGAAGDYDFYRNLAFIGDWNNLDGYQDAPSFGSLGAGLKLKIDFR